MRLLWIALLVAFASAGDVDAAENVSRHVNVYFLQHAAVPTAVRLQAQMEAERMFAEIGVTVEWRCCGDRHTSAGPVILVTLAAEAPHSVNPAALADALPYEGIHIRVFYDRIEKAAPASWRSALLAHVLVHEITHVLQGVSRHSDEGIMKAVWHAADYQQLRWRPLPFTAEDVILIVRGLEAFADGKRAGISMASAAGAPRF